MTNAVVVALARPSQGARRPAGEPRQLVSGRAPADPAHRDRVVAAAEREAKKLSRRITALDSRAGMLREQRDKVLDWLLREAVRRGHPPVPAISSDGRHSRRTPSRTRVLMTNRVPTSP